MDLLAPSDVGLSEKTVAAIRLVFTHYPGINKVWLFGSRAKGSYQPGSDIDLAIEGTLSFAQLNQLGNQLDDLLLPYEIDLLLIDEIDNPNLIKHIQRVKKLFYTLS